MSDKKLIVGIEYDVYVVQACVYDYSVKEPVSADKVAGYTLEDAIEAIKAAYNQDILSICVITNNVQTENMQNIKMQLLNAGISWSNCKVIGKIESFAYYAYYQRKELYKLGSALIEYNDNVMDLYRISCKRVGDTQYIIQEHSYCDLKAYMDNKDVVMVAAIKEYFEGHMASSVYLTGKGFDVDNLPEGLTKVLVSGRKAFIGQNLYVRGACFCAYEQTNPSVFKDVDLLVDGCVKANIETDIMEHSKIMRFRIIKMGTSWYMAERHIEFILEDMTSIPLKMIFYDGRCIEKNIDISAIPYREGKTTRISMDIYFVSPDKCRVTIKDMGFGEIFPSSGQVFNEEIDVSEAFV